MGSVEVETDEMRVVDVDFDALSVAVDIYKLRADSTNAFTMTLLIRGRVRLIFSKIQQRRAFSEVVPKLQFETPRF